MPGVERREVVETLKENPFDSEPRTVGTMLHAKGRLALDGIKMYKVSSKALDSKALHITYAHLYISYCPILKLH
jgi:hypothetical protein